MSFSYNNLYMLKDGKPWFPVMGEMHYSRFRDDLWEESLYKIKAGGLSIVSAYAIWIHHEEEEGVFDFEGSKNLKKFVELCKKVGIYMFLRLGPWVHGEVRNGGFPDWLQSKADHVDLRSDDPEYLKFVRRYWEKIYDQVKGFMYEEGGPIIGIQIENEYGHVGGYTGEKGNQHIRTLTAMAKEIGFNVPLFTATGWGGAVIGDCLPVMGGYCEAPWDQSTTELSANTNYVFSQVRNDALIACDHHVEGAITFDESKFPYLTAELGGGLQVTEHRRPVAVGKDIGAMSLAKLGSGVALLGYYMYHGGSNPEGKFSTLQESKATGYLNNLPEINYDFNAPVRQYGAVSPNYKEIKALAYFLEEWGEDFTVLREEILPDNVKPEDMHTLRVSDRHDDTHGYVFVNNFQRRRVMDAHENVVLVGHAVEEVQFPAMTFKDKDFGFFPYNMQLGDAKLKCATATPLCRIRGEQDTFVFYGDFESQYIWAEGEAPIIHLSREDAMNAWKVTLDKDYLIISDNYVWVQEGELKITGGTQTVVKCYPQMAQMKGFKEAGKDGEFWVYERCAEEGTAVAEVKTIEEAVNKAVYEIAIAYAGEGDRVTGRDTILNMNYAGFGMNIYMDGKKINDHFYTGQEVPISLGYFNFPKKLTVEIQALYKDTPVFIESWPELVNGRACTLNKVEIVEEYR
ncbi:MAG: beta-galactosidase [Lachnospiraceae bacterium]|nr:beta-galactosidase [Lachnospiraceae bacterium]